MNFSFRQRGTIVLERWSSVMYEILRVYTRLRPHECSTTSTTLDRLNTAIVGSLSNVVCTARQRRRNFEFAEKQQAHHPAQGRLCYLTLVMGPCACSEAGNPIPYIRLFGTWNIQPGWFGSCTEVEEHLFLGSDCIPGSHLLDHNVLARPAMYWRYFVSWPIFQMLASTMIRDRSTTVFF